MKVLLVNPPYQTLTSNLGVGHQMPLGLLMVGGALLDAGHTVRLLDTEARHLSDAAIVREVQTWAADVVMTGHAGSTPAHPVCRRMLRAIKSACPAVVAVYGGVYPTYHAAAILRNEPAVDVIVRGEGEATAVDLIETLRWRRVDDLHDVRSIAFRPKQQANSDIVITPDRPPIPNLDHYRIGWELVEDWDRYQCFGMGRAAIVQLSRGCPHRCTYCGQHGFWVKWRHRDPVRLVDEIERLHREHNIRFVTLADENPTTLRSVWQRFLETLIARRLPVHLFATIRATDIVRDADIMHVYKQAGLLYILMGIESTDDAVLEQVRKRSTSRDDFHACQLLRQHGIFSIIGHIVGLAEETPAYYRRAREALALYDGDYLNAMYVTPHRWTPFAAEQAQRPVVQEDQRRWDYRHQVLGQKHLKPWQVFFLVKWLELVFHLRPKRMWRMFTQRDCTLRRQMWWCARHTGLVWFGEVIEFLMIYGRMRGRNTLAEWYGAEENATTPPPAVSNVAATMAPLSVRGVPVRELQGAGR